MKKVFAVLLAIGACLGIGYATGWPASIFGSKAIAESSSPSTGEAAITGSPQSLADSGNAAEAAALLEKKVAEGNLAPSEWKLLARCYRSLGKADGEKGAWQGILDRHPQDAACGDALWGLGALSKEQGRSEEAVTYFEKALDKHPLTEGGRRSGAELGDMYRAKGDRAKARRAYSLALSGSSGGERERFKKALSELNAEILAGAPAEDMVIHTVQPGDSLARISVAYGTTVGMLKVVNRMEGNMIHPGQQLKILKGEVRLEISKSRFLLTVFVGGVWFKEYSVAIGKDNATPEREFEIMNKIENPPWHWKGKVIPPEDPENILGTRWMGFKNKPGLQGFGIHGTRDPSSVPGAASKGCIRMKNEEVEDLFELVPRGSKVIIRA